jgi:3',5'-cyclic-AMP phosphodiesterase
MPIHLPPVSRRRFLASTLTAGTGLLISRDLFAKGRDMDPDSWALVSDIHLAADRKHLGRGINMADHFTQVTNELLDPKWRHSAVLISGDLAFNAGEKADYATVTELLQPIREGGLPLHLALGNHDNRENFWDALAEAKVANRPMADHHVSIVRSSRANWFILDSLEKTLSVPGLLGDAQLDWLAHALDDNKSKPALVVVHHNLKDDKGNPSLKDGDKLMEVLRPRKNVKALFYGHSHIWEVKQDESGIHLVNLPTTAYLFKEGIPNGWVHASLQRKGIQLQLRCLDTKHSQHGETHELKWRA